MAAIKLYPIHTPTSLRVFSSQFPQTTPSLSFNSLAKAPLPFPSISLKPYHTVTPRALVIALAVKNLSETQPVSVPPQTEEVTGKFPSDSGVYAVFDKNDELQFIGLSRNIAASISTHRKSVPELCGSVKVGAVPPGNESGNTTWVRQPPKKKPDLRLTPGRHMQLTVPLEELIDRLVKENKVVVFIKGSRSAPLCGFSQRVIGILESEGVEYESLDILDEEYNYGLRESLKKFSNWPTFPQIFVNGELVGGCDILTSMYEKGELRTLIKK
ncbi:Monothiol glutaredoxin-related [Quillaja saponaria]|uniref:Monothiol glutaredoxin-related n=1 Tax=Quillaja saponaria TaxID=32244 RepID=A0AAD7L237_QUISA|nr:Monothiol glutaredoxin-related [Quillaja saponaria]